MPMSQLKRQLCRINKLTLAIYLLATWSSVVFLQQLFLIFFGSDEIIKGIHHLFANYDSYLIETTTLVTTIGTNETTTNNGVLFYMLVTVWMSSLLIIGWLYRQTKLV